MEGIDKKSKGKGVKDLDEIIIIEKNKDISINLTLSSLEEEIFKELSLEDGSFLEFPTNVTNQFAKGVFNENKELTMIKEYEFYQNDDRIHFQTFRIDHKTNKLIHKTTYYLYCNEPINIFHKENGLLIANPNTLMTNWNKANLSCEDSYCIFYRPGETIFNSDKNNEVIIGPECEFFDKIISEINDDISNFNPPPKLITLQPEKPSSQSLLLTSTPLSYKWIIEYDKDFKNIIVSVLTQTFIKEKEKDKEDWHALDEYDLEITDKLLYGKLLDNTHLILVTTSSIYFFDLNHNHHNGNGASFYVFSDHRLYKLSVIGGQVLDKASLKYDLHSNLNYPHHKNQGSFVRS
ncbi:1101_t:CDS:2 [Entrophospora sp. SA101]|nr:1101_t:CDS:2 [Entrophospora sp. SA101]